MKYLDQEKYIEHIMEMYSLTQKQLAESVDCQQQTASHWLGGKRKISLRKRAQLQSLYPLLKQENYPLGEKQSNICLYLKLPKTVKRLAQKIHDLGPDNKKILKKLKTYLKDTEAEVLRNQEEKEKFQ